MEAIRHIPGYCDTTLRFGIPPYIVSAFPHGIGRKWVPSTLEYSCITAEICKKG